MYVACFVGPNPGHLDFGGSGFLKLAKTLRRRGHDVHWFAAPRHRERLVSEGFSVTSNNSVGFLRLSPLFPADNIEGDIETYRARIAALRQLHNILLRNPPDLMILDRLLTIGQLMAEQLRIPTAVVGTNGGYWMGDGSRAVKSPGPVADYQEVGERIQRDLNWSTGSLDSFWARSAEANISFLGKNYYDKTLSGSARALHVHHFSSTAPTSSKCSHGMSFGNSGDEALMTSVLACLRAEPSVSSPLDIFTGDRLDLFAALSADRRPDERIHQWVDFADYFARLKSLVFFGGIGTVWHCVNSNVPMLAVPGGIGDQLVNGKRVAALGLGECLAGEDVDRGHVGSILRRLTNDDSYSRNISQFKDPGNYTDTLTSAAEKLERLG